jgi:ubiquinone/menaquinone biosynthesis C-methylase UbiE
MRPVDYDLVAPAYGRRYETNRFEGIEECLHNFVRNAADGAIAEVGCGTGHWLRALAEGERFRIVAGLDLSAAMLRHARVAAANALLVRGTADRLPWADASFDRVVCINALHHFPNQGAFFVECSRILRPGGGFLTIGLDPHQGVDTWWIYDYFPTALTADRARYSAAAAIRQNLAVAGFHETTTAIAQHLPAEISFDDAQAKGIVDRHSTSQLMVITDEEYAMGRTRLDSERPVLRADLRLYATTAWR